MLETRNKNAAEATIRSLADRYNVAYQETASDILGSHITRLAGDDVVLDSTELLLLELERSGHITGVEAVRLHAEYLHQARL